MANLSNINGKFVVEQTTGYVGVGTTDPNFLIEAAGVNSEIALNSTSGSIYRVRSTSSDAFIITKNGVGDRLVIDGSGNSTFAGNLISGGSGTFASSITVNTNDSNILTLNRNSTVGGYMVFRNGNSDKLYIGSRGTVSGSGGTGYDMYTVAGNDLKLFTSATLALTLDTSQNATFAGEISQIYNPGNTGAFQYLKNANAGSSAYVSKKWQNDDSGFGEIWRNSSTRNSGAGNTVSSFNMYNSAAINFWPGGSLGLTLDASQNATFAGQIYVPQSPGAIQGNGYPYQTYLGSGANATTTYLQAGSTVLTEIKLLGGDVGRTITFTTASTERMRINNVGNVGIGTTAPYAKLSVKDGTNINLGIKVGQTDATAVMLNAYNDAVTANIPMEFRASKFAFQNGNVGIGTTDPDEKLVLYKPINYNSDSALFSAYAVNSTAVDNDKVFKWRTGITGNATGHSLTFSTLARTQSSYVERMRILSDGNVGIGTSSPTYKLQVAGTTLISGGLKVIGPASYNTFQSANSYVLGLNDQNGTSQWWFNAYTTGDFAIHENLIGDKFTIKAGGNVGIGTTSPIAQLDVAGNTNQHHSVSTSNNGTWRSMINLGTVGWLDQASSAGRVKIYGSENGNTNVSYCEYYVLRSGSGYHIQQIGTRLDVGNTHGQIEARISGNFLQVKNVANSSLGTVRAVLSAMKN